MNLTKTSAKTVIDCGEVLATELVFSQENNDHRYVLQPKGTVEDYLSTIARFPKHSIKCTSEYYIDDTEGKWYACYNVDCFDPSMAIVRARSFESAYEVFCDEWEQWLKVEDGDTADYPEDDRTYNNNGTHIDTSNVQIHELTLLTIEVAR